MESFINEDKFKKCFIDLTNFILEKRWGGACHISVAILYAIAKKLSINAIPCIGEVSFMSHPFDHSWLVINGKVYDIAIILPFEEWMSTGPIYGSVDLKTNKITTIQYGISYKGLDEQANNISKIDLYSYLKNCPVLNAIKLICDIASKNQIYISNKWLKENLSNSFWKIV